MEETWELAAMSEAKTIFLSWSGKRSKALAYIFKEYLDLLVPGVKGWVSEEDISKGKRGLVEIEKKLDEAIFGLVFVTPENKNEPWIQFEAGAISNGIGEGFLSPILFKLTPSELGKSPLGQFQATELKKEDLGRLLRDIEKSIGISEENTKWAKYYEKFWPEINEEISKVPNVTQGPVEAPSREMEMIEGLTTQIMAVRRKLAKPERILPESYLSTIMAGFSDDETLAGKMKAIVEDLKERSDLKSEALTEASDQIDTAVVELESVLETLSANENIASEFKDEILELKSSISDLESVALNAFLEA